MRLHWARVDAIDSKPTLTKGEVEGVELGGAPISVCVLLDGGFVPKPAVHRMSGTDGDLAGSGDAPRVYGAPRSTICLGRCASRYDPPGRSAPDEVRE